MIFRRPFCTRPAIAADIGSGVPASSSPAITSVGTATWSSRALGVDAGRRPRLQHAVVDRIAVAVAQDAGDVDGIAFAVDSFGRRADPAPCFVRKRADGLGGLIGNIVTQVLIAGSSAMLWKIGA